MSMLDFYVGAGDPNSGLYTCTADTLLTEPPPRPKVGTSLSIKERHGLH